MPDVMECHVRVLIQSDQWTSSDLDRKYQVLHSLVRELLGGFLSMTDFVMDRGVFFSYKP